MNSCVTDLRLWKSDHPRSGREFPGIVYVMLHSLAHMLLTAIALEAGYAASSLRERIYTSDGRYGIIRLHEFADPTEYILLGAPDLLKQTKNVWIHERIDDSVPRLRETPETTKEKINNTP